MLELSDVSVGDTLHFVEEIRPYTVRAKGMRYMVCTKPFNPKNTFLYTIVDLVDGVRGAENLVFGFGAETQEQCEQMLERLECGETEISYRNRVPVSLVVD